MRYGSCGLRGRNAEIAVLAARMKPRAMMVGNSDMAYAPQGVQQAIPACQTTMMRAVRQLHATPEFTA